MTKTTPATTPTDVSARLAADLAAKSAADADSNQLVPVLMFCLIGLLLSLSVLLLDRSLPGEWF